MKTRCLLFLLAWLAGAATLHAQCGTASNDIDSKGNLGIDKIYVNKHCPKLAITWKKHNADPPDTWKIVFDSGSNPCQEQQSDNTFSDSSAQTCTIVPQNLNGSPNCLYGADNSFCYKYTVYTTKQGQKPGKNDPHVIVDSTTGVLNGIDSPKRKKK